MKTFNSETLVVLTTNGPIRGGALGEGTPESPAVYAWIRVPYAAPPLGQLMFRAPRDPDPWTDTLDCSGYDITIDDYPTQWDWGQDYFSGEHRVIGTNDCLYLNVWRPQTSETNLPVQMNIHGGSSCNFAALGAKEWEDYVNDANCIIVAPNYRLGPWGNFVHTVLKTGNPLDDSGNFAILDQIKVLQWIQDNIEAFGGDPGNVTVSGQSSGGLQVAMLLHSPLAKNLFHKAIISSAGLYPQLISISVESGYESADQLLLNLLLFDKNEIESEEAAAAAIAQMSKEEIREYLLDVFSNNPLLVFTAYNYGKPNRPSSSKLYHWGFSDGYVVSEALNWDYCSGHYFPKPLIIGATEADMNANHPAQKDSGGINLYRYAYEILYGKDIIYDSFDEAVDALVPMNETVPGGWQNYSANDFKAKYEIASDACLRGYDIIGVHEPARLTAMAPGMEDKVYVYRQDWGSSADASIESAIPSEFEGFFQYAIGADHSSDLWAMYDWNDIEGPGWFVEWTRHFVFVEGNYAGRKDLAGKVAAYLRVFLHSADGTITKTGGMPIAWAPWTAASEQFITWNATARKAVFKMNDKTFTADSLRVYLDERIDALPEATVEDKAALKAWIEPQLAVFGLND